MSRSDAASTRIPERQQLLEVGHTFVAAHALELRTAMQGPAVPVLADQADANQMPEVM